MGYEVGPSGWQPDSEVKAQGRHSGLHRGSMKSGLGHAFRCFSSWPLEVQLMGPTSL